MGKNREAILDYDKAIKLNPKNILAYNNRGNAKTALGLFKEAILDYTIVIRLNSSYSGAYNGRGAALVALKRSRTAIPDLEKAVQLDPGYADAYAMLANVYLAEHRFGANPLPNSRACSITGKCWCRSGF